MIKKCCGNGVAAFAKLSRVTYVCTATDGNMSVVALSLEQEGGGGGGGGKRRGLGPRNDVLTTCKAVTLRGGQRIIALFPTVNIFRLFRSRKRTGRGNQKCLKN